MKYKILRQDGDYDFHNNSAITELPEGAIALTDEEWENRFTNTTLDIESERFNKILARQSYLKQTDWYVAREIDEPNSYPQEIKDKRILARQEINEIETAATLTALNAFSTTF